MSARLTAFTFVCLVWFAQSASAQTFSRIEIGGGFASIGSSTVGSQTATETGSSGSPLTLFTTSTALGWSTGLQASAGVRLSRVIQVEGAMSYAKPTLTTSIAKDFENGPATNATEKIRELTIQVNGIVALSAGGSRFQPFVSGGLGYLRQLHEGDTLLATGRTFQAGGGVRILLRSDSQGRVDRIGLRGDVRVLARTRGVAPDGGTHTAPAFGASVFFGF